MGGLEAVLTALHDVIGRSPKIRKSVKHIYI